MNLDDSAAMRSADPSGMLDAVLDMADHCRQGYEAGRSTSDLPEGDGVLSVVLCGMGGSAVGGDVVKGLFADRLGVPIDVVRGPILPAFAETRTLVVCSSYSGGTAETLAAFEEAVERGCRVVAITSGGEMAMRAEEASVPVVPVPAGLQPRAALGHLALGLLGALEAMELVPALGGEVAEATEVLDGLAAELGPEAAGNPAKALAERMLGTIPVIWGAEGLSAVAAMRWKTQLNENSKVPAWWSAMSELDHNEVAAWIDGSGAGHTIVALRDHDEGPGIGPRFPLTARIAEDAGATVVEIAARGHSELARLLSLVAYGDLVSVYLAFLRGVDPTPVDAIMRLKRELA